MGLDGVELMMDIEDEFDISIPEEEASEVRTPGAVIDWVFGKIAGRDSSICRSQYHFYKLRHVLADATGLSRRNIRPSTPLRDVLSPPVSPELWRTLHASIASYRWPGLRRPLWLRVVLWVTFALIIAAVPSCAQLGLTPVRGWCLTLMLVVGFFFLLIATRDLKRCIPRRIKSVGDLVPHGMSVDRTEWTREQVAQIIKRLTCEKLDLKDEQYSKDADFYRDLGFG